MTENQNRKKILVRASKCVHFESGGKTSANRRIQYLVTQANEEALANAPKTVVYSPIRVTPHTFK